MHFDLRSVGFAEVRERMTGNRLEVHQALLGRGPSTAKELADAMGWDKTSVRPRLCELCQAFHAAPTGARRNHEHEFRALTEEEARIAHARARAEALGAEPSDAQLPLGLV